MTIKTTLRPSIKYSLMLDGVEHYGFAVVSEWETFVKLENGVGYVILDMEKAMDETTIFDMFKSNNSISLQKEYNNVSVIKFSPAFLTKGTE